MAKKKLLITGAGGFVGQKAVSHFLDKGFYIRALVRNRKQIKIIHPDLEIMVGNVQSLSNFKKATKGIWGVVHLAVAKADESDSYATNVGGASNLVKACAHNNVQRIVNVSTGATYLPHKGLYGKTKHQADLILNQSKKVVTLIPGLIYGQENSGAFGALVKAAASPIVPLFGTGQNIFQPIHVDDVVQSIDYALSHKSINRIYDVPGPDQLDFHSIIELIALHIHNKKHKPLFIHIPPAIGLFAAHILSWVTKKPPFTKSNIFGSTQIVVLPTQPAYSDLHLNPRPFLSGLKEVKKNRPSPLEAEGTLLMTYILAPARSAPSPEDSARYARSIPIIPRLKEHTFTPIVYRFPILLGPLECIAARLFPDGPFIKKLRIAATLIESSPSSANWLLPQKRPWRQIVFSLAKITLHLTLKYLAALLLFLFYPLVKRNAS